MLQLFYDVKISCLYEKKTVSDKPWKNMLHDMLHTKRFKRN